MSQSNYEVKQSKKMVIIACISIGIFELFCVGLAVYLIYGYFIKEYIIIDDVIGIYMGAGCFIGFAIIFIIAFIYILHTYIYQVDIYCENKLIRKKGNKVIFELKYDNIKAIRQGYDSLFLVLKEPILKTNGKKGPRNFYEHYSQRDIHRIKQIIASSNYNLDIN